MAPSERYLSRLGAVAALAGFVVYLLAAGLHPQTPPQETEAAFADYAADPTWALVHLGELLGALLMSVALLALAWRLRSGVAGAWALLAGAATVLFAGVYTVFTAVDGVALGVLVERWAEAAPERQEVLFEAAFAVRQVESGLFSMRGLTLGIAAGLFAAAFFADARARSVPRWRSGMGWLSALASLGASAFAVAQAQTGYSETSMAFQPGLLMGLVWVLAAGLFLYRSPAAPARTGPPLPEQSRVRHRELTGRRSR